MIRKLNLLETYGALYNEEQAYNLCISVRYPYFTSEQFFQAVQLFQQKEKCLQVNYDDYLNFYPVSEKIHAISTHLRNNDQWIYEIHEEVNQHFANPKEPLARISHLHNIEADYTDVNFVFSHIIADGHSGILLIKSFEEALMGYWDKKTVRAFDNYLPLTTQLMPVQFKKELKNKSHSELRQMQFDRRKTREIFKLCKTHTTTLHGFMTALLAKAYLFMDGHQDQIKVRSQVGLRPILNIDASVIGNYQIAFGTTIKNESNLPLWDTARQLREQLRTQIKNKAECMRELNELAEKINEEKLYFAIENPVISISTLGVLPFLMTGRILGAATSHYAGPAPHIKIINAIINEKLTLMFQYDARYHDKSFFKTFTFYFLKELEKELLMEGSEDYKKEIASVLASNQQIFLNGNYYDKSGG